MSTSCGGGLFIVASPALATSAKAQSSVALYGLIDRSLRFPLQGYKAGSAAGSGRLTTLTDGTTNGLNGSRLGVRATEDLGDALQAGLVLESGLTADTRFFAQGGRAFGRQAFLSISSPGSGELRLGRQYVSEDAVMALSNPLATRSSTTRALP